MSTCYRLEKNISMNELFGGCLERFGIHKEKVEGKPTGERRLLTEGRNSLWICGDNITEEIYASAASRCPGKILAAIALVFDTNIWSEHNPQFWGFETDDKWEYSRDHFGREGREELYTEIIRFVEGQQNHIDLEVIGMRQAIIAKNLIAENPDLSSPVQEASLMQMIDKEYMEIDFDHPPTQGEDEMMIAKVIASMNDNLRRA
jgi:hypothetical protein